MGSEYGRPKIIQKQKVDRISNLPDDVLSQILSKLPAKSAVATSVLSKKWKNLWTSITCLDFKNHTGTLVNSNVEEFTNFVGHVFRSCNPSQIRKLILHFPWDGVDKSSVLTWIDEWIKGRVSELDLYVHKLPLSVFSCTTLADLTLGYCDYYDAQVVSFDLPCLKVLHINGRFSPFMKNLISSCPALEDLTLGGISSWYLTDSFVVSAHTLKTLRLQIIQDRCCNFVRKITIEAPNLENLHLSEGFFDYNTKGIFSSLVKAYVNIGNASMRDYFQKLPRRFRLANFDYLTSLEVVTCDNRFWALLPKFIGRTPSLEVLSLEQKEDDYVRDDEYDWVEPKFVPRCVSNRLGVIEFEGFKGRKHELQLLKYLLGNAKVLETLVINCQGLKREEEIKLCVQLLEFSRASEQCEVQFHGNAI